MKRVQLLGLQITIGPYKKFIESIVNLAKSETKSYICVCNVHMLVEAHRSGEFRDMVNTAYMCTPDGVPLAWALKLLYNIKQDRVAGMDILPDLLERCQEEILPVFFYGGAPEMLESASGFLKKNYPNLNVAGTYSPPFRPLTETEVDSDIQRINSSGAKLVFVCLGCPKQEKWMYAMRNRINVPMIGIGGALPVMIGLQQRAPVWMQTSGLEWLYRFLQEPKRLFKRYAVTNFIFIMLLIKALLNRMLGKKSSPHLAS